jgi:6-pyruvoyl tetrahydropterin synthase/QueD family protein
MATIRLTKEFTFEAAHSLEGYDGACREIHGHSYRLFVTIKGEPSTDVYDPKQGMVMDFGLLKRIVNEQIVSRFDHAFVVRRTMNEWSNCDIICSPTMRLSSPKSITIPCLGSYSSTDGSPLIVTNRRYEWP